MNCNRYRTIFSKRLGMLVPVAEIAKTRGKSPDAMSKGSDAERGGSSPAVRSVGTAWPTTGFRAVTLAVTAALWGQMAFASPPLPTGGDITSGSGSIGQSGNTLTVNQSSQNLAANWQSFDIGTDHAVVFNQPNSSAVALNRVVGSDASSIYGNLSANGHVFLVNPNGVLFAPGSQVSTGGLVASTLNISDVDFAAGRYRFTDGSGAGSVVNEGSIEAGSVALLGPKVVNSGAIHTPGGNTTLAAGDRVTVSMLGGLLSAEVDASVLHAEIQNHGRITADGGRVGLLAGHADSVLDSLINTDGVIQANSLRNENGRIYLDGGAGGTVTVSGTLDASGAEAGTHGGDVTALGKHVGLMEGAQLDASGAIGGGTVLIGGNWQGKGPEHNAEATYMDADATIRADATGKGNGGTVVLWSEDYTGFYGNISARGGVQGGDGGSVETSSHGNLQSFGQADAAAPAGAAGEWLLDPSDVTISTAATSGGSFDNGDPDVFTPSAGISVVNNGTINTSLDLGTSVTITTSGGTGGSGDITVNAPISKSAGGDATLHLKADRHIFVNGGADITSTAGALDIILNAHYSDDTAPGTVLVDGATFNSNGGDIIIGGGSDPVTTSAIGQSGVQNGRGVVIGGTVATTLNAGAGNIFITGQGADSAGVRGEGVSLDGASSILTSGDGTITINGTASSDASATVPVGIWFGGSGVTIASERGAIELTGTGGTTSGTYRSGIVFFNPNARIYSVEGSIGLTGISRNAAVAAIWARQPAYVGWDGVGAATTGDITILGQTPGDSTLGANSLNLTNMFINGSGGNLTVGSTGTGLSGLTLSSGVIASGATWNNATIGDANTGAVAINGNTFDAVGAIDIEGSSYSFANNNTLTSNTLSFGTNDIGNTGTLTLEQAGDVTVANVISGTGSLVQAGAGTLTLTGDNTYTGTTTIDAGAALQVGDGGTAGTLGTGAVTDDGSLVFDRSDALTVANAIGGTGSVTQAGSGTTIFTGNNSYSGTTAVDAGVLQSGNGGTTGTLGTGAATIDVDGTLEFFRSDSFAIGNSLSGSGTLSFLGTGASNQSSYGLSGNNTGFTGTVVIDKARLQYDNANDLGAAAPIYVLSGGQIYAAADITNAMSLNGTGWQEPSGPFGALRLGDGVTASGDITLQSDSRIMAQSVDANAGTISGAISGSGALETGGNHATLILSGANTFSGPLHIRHGVNASAVPSVILAPTGSLATTEVIIGDASSANSSGNYAVLQHEADDQMPDAVVTLDASWLRWAYMRLLGTSQSVLGIVDSSGAGVVENTETQTGVGNGTLTLTGDGNYSFSGFLRNIFPDSDRLALVKNGTGTQTLSGTRINYTGATTVNDGTLSLVDTGGYNSATTVNSEATLELAGTADIVHAAGFSLALNDGSTLNKSNAGFNGFDSSNVSINGAVDINVTNGGADNLLIGGASTGLTGSGTINLTNTGDYQTGLTLTGDQHGFSGTMNVSGGVLNLVRFFSEHADLTLANSDLNLTESARLDLAGTFAGPPTNASVKSLNGDSTTTVALGARTLTLGTNDGTGADFAGVISGTGALVKTGAGMQTLSGDNSYSGTTTIDAGTLQVGNNGTTGTLGTGAVTNDAELVFNRSDTVSLANLADGGITGTGNVTALIGGGLTVDRDITLTGANSSILLEAGKDVAAGTVAGGDVTLGSDVSTSAGGTITIFSGNVDTAGYEAQVSGADGATRRKTYNASASDTSGATTGTRNYYYREQPTTLAVSGLTATKDYDGLLDAMGTVDGSGTTISGAIDGDTVAWGDLTLIGANFDNAHTGSRVLNADFSVNPFTYTAGGSTWSVSGYAGGTSANAGVGTITPKAITVGIDAVGKTYDGLTGTTSTLGTLSGFIGNDSATGVDGLLLAFDNPNAGTQNVVASGTGNLSDFTGTASGNGSGIGVGNEVAGVAGDYVVAASPASAVIAKAALTVTANDDAKIVTQGDGVGYNGASYGGFVNGEGAADLSGGLSITRSNAGTETAGDYAGVLSPTGLTSGNYDISYVDGDFKILPAEQLLIRIQNVISVYGTEADYDITTVQYLDGGGATLYALTQTAQDGNTYTYSDGAGGSVTFTVAPGGAVISSAGLLAVGNYELLGIDASIGGSNFNAMDYVGNQTVTQLGLTPLPGGGVSKVYDGTTSLSGVSMALSGLLTGDEVLTDASGGFSSKNAGNNLGYTINNIALSGSDAGNYYLTDTGGFSGGDGVITPRSITASGITANDKIYDGTTGATLTTSGYALNGLVTGDTVGLDGASYNALFGDRNAGTGKAVSVTGLGLSGADAGNYTLTQPAGLTANITPRALTVTAVTNSKDYDGTTSASALPIVSGELVGGDSFALFGEEYATANVGTNLTLIPLISIEDGNGGANYALTLVNDTTGEIRSAVDLSQVGGSHTAASLSNAGNDGQGGNGGDSADSANGDHGSGSAGGQSSCTRDRHCNTVVQVIATGLKLPQGMAASGLDDFNNFNDADSF